MPLHSGGVVEHSSFFPQGQVIGVNTAIFTNTGTSAGVGFAIPIDIVRSVVPQLIQYGKVVRPALNIQVPPAHLHAPMSSIIGMQKTADVMWQHRQTGIQHDAVRVFLSPECWNVLLSARVFAPCSFGQVLCEAVAACTVSGMLHYIAVPWCHCICSPSTMPYTVCWSGYRLSPGSGCSACKWRLVKDYQGVLRLCCVHNLNLVDLNLLGESTAMYQQTAGARSCPQIKLPRR